MSRPAAGPTSVVGQPSRLGPTTLAVAIDTTPLLGPRTGVGAVTAALVEQLARRSELTVTGYVVSWRGAGRHHQVLPAGCHSYHLPFPARLSHLLWRHLDRPALPRRFDLIHAVNYVLPPGGGGVGLITVHDLTAWRFPQLVSRHSAAYPILVERALARGAHLHCVSGSVADEVRDHLAVPEERVHVVPNGFTPVPPGDPDRGRSKAGGRYVLTLGTVEPRKDHPGLVRAMADVWCYHPELRLVIGGGEGWGSEALDRAMVASGAGRRVVRLGYITDRDKADLLAGAELLVFPSIYEGFGLPVLEAMDAGVPVVSTMVGAIAEVAGSAAVLVGPGDRESLADAILRVLEDDRLRRALIEQGHRRTELFSWARMGQEMTDLYQALTSR